MSEKLGDDPSDIKEDLGQLIFNKVSEIKKNRILVTIFFIVVALALYSQNYDSIFLKDAQARESKEVSDWQMQEYTSLLCFEKDEKVKSSFTANSNKKIFCPVSEENSRDLEKEQFQQELDVLVGGFPIEDMTEAISEYNRDVAGLIVGIAKKESNWGKRSPVKNGKICYNYWGYKGSGSRGSSLGYACFSSPEEAVGVIGKRIEKLVSQGLNTPKKMLVWKCGSSCAGHNPEGVNKWVSDVGMYFRKINAI